MIAVGYIAKAAQALLEGKIDSLVNDKLEKLGEEFLTKQLAGPFGLAGRIAEDFTTGGQSELDRLRTDLMNSVRPGPVPYQKVLNKLFGIMEQTANVRKTKYNRKGRSRWERSSWATSRDDWLDNHWRHDWRSQPRNEQGRWIPGRLGYIEMSMHYKGVRPGRKKKRRRRSRRRGRFAARSLFEQLRKKPNAD